MNPYYDGDHENIGLMWQWYADDFQVSERRWIKETKKYSLKYYDKNDNYFERYYRKKYHERKYKKFLKDFEKDDKK